MRVSIIDYGAGNVQSLEFALNRLGVSGILTSKKEIIMDSDKVISVSYTHLTLPTTSSV